MASSSSKLDGTLRRIINGFNLSQMNDFPVTADLCYAHSFLGSLGGGGKHALRVASNNCMAKSSFTVKSNVVVIM